jgi:methylthioribose-1-phosphate isomerase
MSRIDVVVPLAWSEARFALRLLDQRRLPLEETWIDCATVDEVACAIRDMVVRGAPAIGITAAFGMVLAARQAEREGAGAREHLRAARDKLAATRPTAVNLFWALQRMGELAEAGACADELLAEAKRLHAEDIEGNRKMGLWGAARIEDGMGVLTHCNAGALATGGIGTAIGVIATAHAQGKRIHVYVDETRPRLQGARLTAWELSRLGIPATLICDNMAASLMARGRIQLCVTGADRIAANGDAANKIGTYGVAIAAHHHQVPFHIAAPHSTFDLAIPDGSHIPIEERDPTEVTDWAGQSTCPVGMAVFNPSFDVTPASLIRSIFTDRGEIAPVQTQNVLEVLGHT